MTITTTTTAKNEVLPDRLILAMWGYIAVVVCGFCFGSASLPIKKFEAGDGVVFQLASSLALWSVGLIVHCIRSFPRFYFLPMIGGFLFATANVKMVVKKKSLNKIKLFKRIYLNRFQS